MCTCVAATLAARVVAAAPFAYVVNHGSGDVSVVDTATNVVVATVPVGDQPLGAAVNPAGTRVYVANQVTPSGTVSVIDTASNTVIATIGVGAGPSGVAVKLPGDRVYVTNRDDKSVSVIDTTLNAVVDTVTVENNPLGVVVDPAGTPAYVVNKGSNDVSVIDTNANVVVGTIAVGNDPSQVAIGPNGQRAYVSNTSNASVSVIDTVVQAVVDTVSVGAIPEGVAVDAAGARLYVANSGPNSVSVVDTASDGVVATVPVGLTPFELAVRPDDARVFVANRASASVSVIDTATNGVTATVDVGANPAGMGTFIQPGLRVPRFGKTARKCQVALLRQAIALVKLQHALEVACKLGVIKAEAAGTGTAQAEAACAAALDLGNPGSKLAAAHAKVRAAVQKSCGVVAPRQINGPCDRGALGVPATLDCLLDQHVERVQAIVANEFSAARPVPLARAAVACQTAIAKNGRRLAERLHKDFGACLEKVLAAADAGKGEASAAARCLATLDLGNPASKGARAEAAALAAIAKKCAAVTPADLGSPCDDTASTTAATASCVLGANVAGVGKLVAAEANDACAVATRLGLGTAFPAVCTGPR